MGSGWIMDPTLHLVERSSGIIDLTLGSMDVSGYMHIYILSIDLNCGFVRHQDYEVLRPSLPGR